MSRPLILVTNDDGVNSKGISALIEIAQTFGDVFVVAPNGPQSGKSHAISLEKPIGVSLLLKSDTLTKFSCTGTPVDCVKLALNKLMDKKPDIILSGINHGSNSSINVIYSGTMGAAIEGFMDGIPSIGFSLLDYNEDADFSACKHYLGKIIDMALNMEDALCLNVNIPKLASSQIKGFKFCRQADSNWQEEFVPVDEINDFDFYWMKGSFVNQDYEQDTDEWALDNGYISIVPIEFDFTEYKALENLKNIEL
ncbi:5'/3'-nucleotidase SurE [Flavobacteriales bacterium]|nr:5'/3'-nucleotidase SurE [Flavobacteriales bacterium]